MKGVFLCLAFLGVVNLSPLNTPTASTCGYDSCPAIIPNFINVHLISHTHDDVGWLKTVDEYFYGDKNGIQSAGVQYILDTVVEELQKNPDRRFIYVEMSFFWRWWNNRDDTIHEQVQALVQSGQLEFINGAWSMSDEAGNHYSELIDEHTRGFRFLNDTFGPCAAPRVGWQIDPFGHSRETASLFAQFGYDGLFFGRLDYQDKDQRILNKTMEFIWDGSTNIGVEADLFTGVLPNMYFEPNGFCFDIGCTDPPIKDDINLKDYNVDSRVNDFVTLVNQQAEQYRTNNLVMTMGSDFNYQDAATWFVNLDKLIKYVNARQSTGSKINVFYSTPSCYVKSLNDAGLSWSVKTDDFFPYASDDHTYWTGYFTSRPGFKGYTKFTNNILQVGKQTTVYSRKASVNEANLDWLRRYQGDAQHHDSITGTAKQAVNDDYTESLYKGASLTQEAINNAYSVLQQLDATQVPNQTFCHYLNVSYCPFTEENAQFSVIAYNALGFGYTTHIRVPVTGTSFSVSGATGGPVPYQLIPIPDPVMDDPEKAGTATNELVFPVTLQPSGFTTFLVEQTSAVPKEANKPSAPVADDLVISNEFVTVTVDGTTGLLKSITDINATKTYNVAQNFFYYSAFAGNNSESDTRASGAYIFRPDGIDPVPVTTDAVTAVLIDRSPVVQEIQQNFSDYVSQVIRVYPGEAGVEFEWFVGPIPIEDGIGKEVISRFNTDLVTNELFYTDANGREVLQRKLNYRETWTVDIAEPVSGNYYPVNSRIFINDSAADSQLTVVTDRSEGGSSLHDGELELMLHRRLLYDDAKGVDEALNELGVDGNGLRVRGKHQVFVSSVADAAKLHRVAALKSSQPPLLSFGPITTTVEDYYNHFKVSYSGLTPSALPANVKLLTLEPWKGETVLLRLEHFYEANDDPTNLSKPVTFNIANLFADFIITSATETTLGANVWLADLNRMNWERDDAKTQTQPRVKVPAAALDVTLNPMEIKTFIITITYT